MSFSIRRATAGEFPALAELDGANFGFHYGEQELADARVEVDPEQFVIATDAAGTIVGLSADVPLQMTVPGGRDVATMGLTWVSVEVTHRRRGILRAIVERQLREHAAAGMPATILSASEGGIYGRFGFGVATAKRRTVVDRRRARLTHPVDASAVRRLSTRDARDLLPALFERWRAQVPGGVSRDDRRWRYLLLDSEVQRSGRSGLFHLVHPDGYLSYRIKADWNDGDPRHQCWVVDYAPATPEAHAALWQTLLGMDLVATVDSYWIPLDDPLPHLLVDSRQVQTVHLADGLWLRPLDVAALLSARSYALEVETVLGVTDRLLGESCYQLRGGPDGASCEHSERPPDVSLDVSVLGALCLGGTRLATLARAGLVRVADPRRLVRLDRALLADRAPFPGTHF